MALTMADHLVQRGKTQGIEQGIEQGIQRGIKQGETGAKRAAILKLLRLRFDGVPDSLANEISSIEDFSLLNSLFEKAATASTLDEIDLKNRGGSKVG